METHIATVATDDSTAAVSDVTTTEVATKDGALAAETVTAAVANSVLATPVEQTGPGPMIDTWRKLHPKDEHYTYFSYRFNARLKGIGWRIDHCE